MKFIIEYKKKKRIIIIIQIKTQVDFSFARGLIIIAYFSL